MISDLKSIIKAIVNLIRQLSKTAFDSAKSAYDTAPPQMQKGAKRILGLALAIVIVSFVWQVGSDFWERRSREAELRKGPQVKVAKVGLAPAERTVKQTGEARPYASVTLYAKVSGYLKKVNVDKGDVVKKGQVLASIESDETDKAYLASLADARNKKSIFDRIQKLFDRGLVSQQEADQAQSDYDVAKANLESHEVLKSYETLRAPFDGTITARYADPGALMQNAANSQTSALPVLNIAVVDQLRVYVYLDQRDAAAVEKGAPVEISVAERPDDVFVGHVARLSGALDEKTKMLLTEVDLENKERRIVPGSFVHVVLHIKSIPGPEVPADALVLRDGRTMVPVVDEEKSEVTYKEVRVLENDGQKVKVSGDIKVGDKVALSLGNTVADHGKVRILAEVAPVEAAAAASPLAPAPAPAVSATSSASPAAAASTPQVEPSPVASVAPAVPAAKEAQK